MEFHALSGNAFVGREEEIRLLEAELAEASAGRGRLVTLAGDAGIGKTRAVEEFVGRAPIPSGRVAWGPCPRATRSPGILALGQDHSANSPDKAPILPRADRKAASPSRRSSGDGTTYSRPARL